MVVENNEFKIVEDFSSDGILQQQSNINNVDIKSPNCLSMLNQEGHDEYYKNIFSLLIQMLDASIAKGNIERLENDLVEVSYRYNKCDKISNAVSTKIHEAQFELMCKFLENKNFEKAKTLCENFDESMEDYVVNRIKNNNNDLVEDDNYYAAMTKIDITERIAVNVNSIKFWEGVLNIEKPHLKYRLPEQWQPDNSLVPAKERALNLSINSWDFFRFVRVFRIRYNPKSEKNKMNLGDIQKLREYLIRPKVTKNIRIIFEEGIEDVYLDLNNVNILCNISIKLPSTCKRIGGNIFRNNTNISNVDLSGTQIESIDDDTFYNSKIRKLIVPSTLKLIGRNAFANCYDLRSVDLSATQVYKISRNAFYNSGIKDLKVSNDLYHVDLEAFSNCKNLDKLDLSETRVAQLDAGFLAYSGVKKIKLPPTISEIDFGVFSDCKELKEIDLSKTNVRKIGAYSFFNSNIEKIKLPNTIEEIDYEAFGKCRKLKDVDFRKTKLRKVAPYAFYDSGVEIVRFPNSLKEVSVTSFKDCRNLKKLKMPD